MGKIKRAKDFLLHEFFGMKEDGTGGSGGIAPVDDKENRDYLQEKAEEYNKRKEASK